MKHYRVLLRGEACHKQYNDDGGVIKHTARTNDSIRRQARIPLVLSTLRYRRLRWLAEVGKHPEDNVATLAALTGELG
eukprot:9485159-Pyramimonas_sp.AAC.1